jgi:hypothetical protein
MLELRVNEALPGDEIRIRESAEENKLRIRARTWGHPSHALPTRLQIICSGDVLKESISTSNQTELQLNLDLEAQFSVWIAARADGNDGSVAHTTPVYVIREPFRFWNFEKAPKLIEQRLSSLDEVEQLIIDARTQSNAVRSPLTSELIDQSADLLARVQEARMIYRDLMKTWSRERHMREVLP